jgi:ferredoxin
MAFFLKRVRLAVSLVTALAVAIVFLTFAGVLPSRVVTAVTFLQFVPSLLKFTNVAAVSAIGFAIVLLLTLLFGRVYCSFLCPLGTLQDGITWLARKVNRKSIQKQSPRYDTLRFGLLAVSAIGLVAGSTLFVNLLDPFSNAGRILTHLVRPFVVGANNLLASTSQWLGLYWMNPVEPVPPAWPAVVFALGFLGVVSWFAWTRGRLYCNTVCPVGALLGLASRIAVWKIVIDEGDCKSCGLCERVCKGGCIDRKAKIVDFDRCVGCFDCFDVCPRDGMAFRTPWIQAGRRAETNDGRRRFLQRVTAVAVLLTGEPGKKVVPTKLTTIPAGSAVPVSPPGSASLEHFTETCTACHLCVDACIANVLQPSVFEYGIGGIFQPRMDYRTGYCNYDCTACGEICPSGAILPLARDEKKLTQLGVAKFVKDNCVVKTEHTDCGACSEHCPTKAVTMVSFEGKLVIPEVKEEICIGCGACEHACPTKPYKAIYVQANAVHRVAKKPEVKKVEPPKILQEDFPF